MFKKTERLTQAEFTEFFKRGRRHHFKHLTVITAPHPARKVAVVAGKKVAKSAVRRNLLRRRVYATLRAVLPPGHTGVLIVLLKPAFASLARQQAATKVREAISEVISQK